jgi:hypothetical protein
MRNYFQTILLFALFSSTFFSLPAQDIQIARLKYAGGGDWYNDPSALANLLAFTSKELPMGIDLRYQDVDLGSSELYRYPFAFMTGHGGLKANAQEMQNMRTYLESGGFLYVDDDYGFNDDFRDFISSLFPSESLTELPWDHRIFNRYFRFEDGLPKIHEHNGKTPQAFGLFLDGRLAILYTYESNLSDGWTDASVHKNPEAVRQAALRMGANILLYAINGE